jgi:glycerophosphoryl diester phosphodiesterase
MEKEAHMTGCFDQARVIVAHRGFRARCPENTLSAFKAAEAAGAQAVELDVALTRDRHPAVIHDDAVDRTTNGVGPVAGFTLDELKRLDAGAWFDPAFAGERIPTLAEVFDHLGEGMGINIEIKGGAVEPDFPSDAVERQVVRLVAERAARPRVIVSSFDWPCLFRVRELDSRLNIGVLSVDSAAADALAVCRRLGAFSWHPAHENLDRTGTAQARAAGFRVLPYTVNDPGEMQRLFDLGVDGVITDDPVAALHLDLGGENR